MTIPENTTIKVNMPFLTQSRLFPEDSEELREELNKAYIETSTAVNARTIGIYDTFQSATGNKWFNDGDPNNPREGYHKGILFDNVIAPGGSDSVAHNIDDLASVVKFNGSCQTTVPDWRPFGVDIQISVTDTDVIIALSATASFSINSAVVFPEYVLI